MNSQLFLLRRLVVATAVPPFRQIYVAAYQALIEHIVRRLRRHPAVKAVYLRRGCAKEENLPGVSDIDFAVVADATQEERERFCAEYTRLARHVVLLDRGLE